MYEKIKREHSALTAEQKTQLHSRERKRSRTQSTREEKANKTSQQTRGNQDRVQQKTKHAPEELIGETGEKRQNTFLYADNRHVRS